MPRPSRDWRSLFLRYQRQNLKSGVTIKDWCSRNKIPYSLCRKNFSKIRAEMTAEADQIGNSVHNDSYQDTPGIGHADSSEKSEKQKARPKKSKGGGQIGNKNGLIHGLYEKLYGEELWAAAKGMTRELRLQALQAKLVRADMKANEYKEQAEALTNLLEEEGRTPTEDEYDRLKSLDSKIESSLVASSIINGQIEAMENNEINRDYTRASIAKTKADTRKSKSATRKLDAEAIKAERDNDDSDLDKNNKQLQGELLQANIDKTKKQTELTTAQINALDKDGGRDHDDIDDLLDEIMEQRDGLMRDIPEDH